LVSEVRSLLALLVQKHKYWQKNIDAVFQVRSLLALLVQKYKYWQAIDAVFPVRSLLALLVQKYKYWQAIDAALQNKQKFTCCQNGTRWYNVCPKVFLTQGTWYSMTWIEP
jgi:hypothetical protein